MKGRGFVEHITGLRELESDDAERQNRARCQIFEQVRRKMIELGIEKPDGASPFINEIPDTSGDLHQP
jgi:hypothetical protein